MLSRSRLLPCQELDYCPSGFTGDEHLKFANAITDPRFQDATTYREQVYILVSLLHDVDVNAMDDPSKDCLAISYAKIGKCFRPSRNHGSIIKEFEKYGKVNNAPGRPYVLTKEEVDLLAEELKRLAQEGDYPSIDDIISFIYSNFEKVPSRPTIYRTITQRIQGFKLIKAAPIEMQRRDVTFEQIAEFYETLQERITKTPVGFVFNLDESGECKYVDANDIYVYVPDHIEKYDYPVDRSTRRITLLHCIATDGSSCDPLIIIPRKTIDNEIFDQVTPQTVLIRHHPKGFLTFELFTEWLCTTFIPYLCHQRIKYNYAGEALILMDGFRGHDKSIAQLRPLLDAFQLDVLKISEHSSNQVQPLDLVGFNLQL